jgi:molybdenum cofactor cytidylyltransferase
MLAPVERLIQPKLFANQRHVMNLAASFRLSLTKNTRIAFVGAGGKTTAMFQLAHELAPALVTTSTHLGAWQVSLADRHIIWPEDEPLPEFEAVLGSGVTLITGVLGSATNRLRGLTPSQLATLDVLADYHDLPVLVEADGARQLPLKAPATHEPAIPPFADLVILVVGLSALGKPLSGEWVHRPERFSALTGLEAGAILSPEVLSVLLTHPEGGLKNIPVRARRVALLNQADTAELQSAGSSLARRLLPAFHSVVIASLSSTDENNPSLGVHAVHELTAGIVLAGGGSSRFGQPKQLLPWEGEAFARRVARTALEAGLSPVIVVTGAYAAEVSQAVKGLDIRIANNSDWQAGQSGSVRTGVQALPPESGSAVFLLADQPRIPSTLIAALAAEHARTLAPIVAPLVDGRRGNPVLFDRTTFPDLLTLTGDTGGRVLFSRFQVTWLPWHDAGILADVDTVEDYRRYDETAHES